MSDEHSALARLAQLERALAAVRAELGRPREKTPRKAGPFQAVRVVAGEVEFAIPSDFVREVVRYARLTPLSGAPAAAHGALNLRGELVPVLGLSRLLRRGEPGIDLRTAIVVLSVHSRVAGILVARVLDVVTLDSASLVDPSNHVPHERFVSEVSCSPSGFLQLLDVEELVSPAALALLDVELSGATSREDLASASSPGGA